jgi:hypothetical protein
VGFGSFFHSRISNEAFHAMLLNPPYMSVMTEGGSKIRSEKRFLVDSVSNLMIGGLLIYIIPYYRLSADICRVLCDNFCDISIWKFTSDEFKRFKQVAVFGTRHKRCDGSAMVAELASSVLSPGDLPELTELPAGRYQLPAMQKEVALFKGAEFNVAELSEQLSQSKSFSRLFQRSALDSADKRPLLPLSLGQIGLVGGSGLINGLVECDTPHIIKGRVVKEKRIRTDEITNARGDLMSTGDSGTIVDAESATSDDVESGLGHTEPGGSDKAPITNDIVEYNQLFPLGRTVITHGAREALCDTDINSALQRHQTGDWGDVPERDGAANDNAVRNGDRILSSYNSSNDVNFWIITEWDRSATTVLLPEEY